MEIPLCGIKFLSSGVVYITKGRKLFLNEQLRRSPKQVGIKPSTPRHPHSCSEERLLTGLSRM
jgi:hypothetical protein